MIDSIGFSLQSAVTLYIYRVGKTYPARNPIYRYKSIKNSNYSRTPPRLVRPVGSTGQTGWAPAGSATAPDWSDRLVIPVRPVDANFGCQHTVIVIRLHLNLALQLGQFQFELFYLSLEFIIVFSDEVITRFYGNMLNTRLGCLGATRFITR